VSSTSNRLDVVIGLMSLTRANGFTERRFQYRKVWRIGRIKTRQRATLLGALPAQLAGSEQRRIVQGSVGAVALGSVPGDSKSGLIAAARRATQRHPAVAWA